MNTSFPSVPWLLALLICLFHPLAGQNDGSRSATQPIATASLIVLGNVQDAGSPHAGCQKACCEDLFLHPDPLRKVVSLGLVDPEQQVNCLLEATPDLPTQMKMLHNLSPFAMQETPNAIFLTHAHIGHYAGLMYLGREGMNAPAVPVYAMPRMGEFLAQNGPWDQLVRLKNIELRSFENNTSVELSTNIHILPIVVPHRDEYSETVGYLIQGPQKRALFIPDIDKWGKWDRDISAMISEVDYAFIDGTFYDAAEINNRNIAEIPHPFVTESMEHFKTLTDKEKDKIYFIHFNHTNPLLNPKSAQSKTVLRNGFHIARTGQVFTL